MAEQLTIDVPLQVVDGWPPVAAEAVWAIRDDRGVVIDGIPVFALDLCRGDTVETVPGDDGVPRLVRRVRRGGHSTFRFIALVGDDVVQPVADRLAGLGADVVRSSFPALWALDVPPLASVEAVRAALVEAAARGAIEFEDPRSR